MTTDDLRPHGYAPGDYVGRCGGCEAQFVGAKRSLRCRKCAEGLYALSQENKQRAKENAEWLAWRDRNPEAAGAIIAGTAAVVPVEATAENGMKYALSGEFKIGRRVVEWSTIKDIVRRFVAASRLDRGALASATTENGCGNG
jgi:hypothetical protein